MSDQEIRDFAASAIREEFSRRHIGVNRIILFGSRSGGSPRSDSDWDFLVVTDSPLTRERRIDAQNAVIAKCARSMVDIELVVRDTLSFESEADMTGALVHNAVKNGVVCE